MRQVDEGPPACRAELVRARRRARVIYSAARGAVLANIAEVPGACYRRARDGTGARACVWLDGRGSATFIRPSAADLLLETLMPIEHISDTARWVAVYRAMESERPDALFHDPFAKRLAGARGEEIVDTMKRGRQMAWAMIVRTAVFDELIMQRVRAGTDLVVNLAAGLDARPWRLELPATLRWIDVDLPAILRYKTDALRDAAPACRYETMPVDLTDPIARRALVDRLGAAGRDTLIVTEGLLVYLSEENVDALARDLHAGTTFRWWLIDLASPRLLNIMTKYWGREARSGNAAFRFAPAEGTAFFRPSGWREAAFRSSMEEARRLRREMRMMWLWRFLGRLGSAEKREEVRRMSGTILLEHD